jgi:SAM-dependent methyltransferase
MPLRAALTMVLLGDLAAKDPDEYHHFLWAHHLAYAEGYEIEATFGQPLHPLRRELLHMLLVELGRKGLEPETDVLSVLDVGCSLGYLLRHVELDVFPGARTLMGLDVDDYAVRTGTEYLTGMDSKIELVTADLRSLGRVVNDRMFDVVLCCGVLLYLRQESAAKAVDSMLHHARHFVVMNELAEPDVDNGRLTASRIRSSDGGFIHNLDEMVQGSGGEVVARRWGGREIVGGNSVYLVVAAATGEASPEKQ